jgi:membrane-associated phospholipid phosphatase
LTSNLSPYLALFFFACAFVEVVFLSALVPLDAALARWVETQRSCALDRFNAGLANGPIIFLVGLTVGALIYLYYNRRQDEVWWGVRTIVSGLFLSELLKTGLERARPSMLPSASGGNSFPSGHVVGAVLLAGTLGILLIRQRCAAWVKILGLVVLIGFVSVIAGQRVYLGRHWLSDVVGSVLLAGGWLCCTLSSPAVITASWRTLSVYALLLVCYQGFYLLPQSRFTLPSAIAVKEEPFLSISFGRLAPRATLSGAWGEETDEPTGPITWMRRGEASVALALPVNRLYQLKLAVRPFVRSKTFACFPLEIFINQRLVSRLLLSRGWREYALPLDPAWIMPGANVITFRAADGFPEALSEPGAVAFRHLRFFAEER